MKALRQIVVRLMASVTRRRDEGRLRDEIEQHLALQTEANLTAGLSPEEARRQAVLKFGGIGAIKEQYRDQHGLPVVERLIQDLRDAARGLTRSPGFASVTVLTLSLAIAANVAIFSIVNAILIRPLPYPESERIVTISHHAPGLTETELQSSPGLIAYYRDAAPMLSHVAGFQRRERNLTSDSHPERIETASVTPELFDVLAVHPVMGRRFYQSDAQENAPAVALLVYSFWQSRFGADPGIVGRRVEIDGRHVEIVGVMSQNFVFPDRRIRLLMPLWLDPKGVFGDFGTHTVARLAPTVTVDAAREQIQAMQSRIPERFRIPAKLLEGWRWSVTVESLHDTVIGDISKPLWIVFSTVVFVLLIAAANVANLFLARAESRRHEVAVRSALGASHGRIAAAYVIECLVLAFVSGTVGFVMTAGGMRLLRAYGPVFLPRLDEMGIDWAVVGFTVAVCALLAVGLGLLPTTVLGLKGLAGLAAGRGASVSLGTRQRRFRQALIVAQLGIALPLLVASGVMVSSMVRLHKVEPGVTVQDVVVGGVSFGAQPDRRRAVAFYHQLLDEIGSLPSVASVGATSLVPLEASLMNGARINIKSRPQTKDEIRPIGRYKAVSAGYFETFGIALLQGRLPVRADAEQDRSVVWVNESFARQLLDHYTLGERVKRAVGETFQIAGRQLAIAGVVSDVREFDLREAAVPTAYLPLNVAAVNLDLLHVVVHTRGPQPSVPAAVREIVVRLNPSVPVTSVRTMEDVVQSSLAEMSLTLLLLALATSVAVTLSVVGVYGVTRYVISKRTGEIGVRLALGAQPQHVRLMMLREHFKIGLVGIACGLVAAYMFMNVMTSLVYRTSSHDPVILCVSALLLLGISIAAAGLAVRQTTNLNPLIALRCE